MTHPNAIAFAREIIRRKPLTWLQRIALTAQAVERLRAGESVRMAVRATRQRP